MSIFDRLKKAPAASSAATAKDAKKPASKAKAKTTSTAKTGTSAAPANGKTVLLRPLVTEKATLTGTYVFLVARSANKTEIAKAIQAQYGVKPKNVRVLNVYGKKVRWNYREGKRQDWKKAIVRLPEGQTINVYEVA